MGVQVTGNIDVTSPTDTFPTHLSVLGNGGLHEVANKAARNAITSERRRQGMMVFTQDDGKYYSLTASTFTGTDADWTLLEFGAGAAEEVEIIEFPTPEQTWTMNHTLGGYPTVTFMTLDGTKFEAAVQYVSTSQIVAEFEVDGGFAGRAVLRGTG